MDQGFPSDVGNKGVWICWVHGWSRWRQRRRSTGWILGSVRDTKARRLIIATNTIYRRSLVNPLTLLWDGTAPTDYEYARGPWRAVRYRERER